MANLQELWRQINHTLLMQVAAHLPWGEPRRSTCSGIMILNMPLFAQQFFDCVQQIPNLGSFFAGDQTLIALVAQEFPNQTGILPPQWGNRNLGHGWQRSPHELMEQSQNSMAKSSRGGGTTSSDGYSEAGAGLLHFQGGAGCEKGQQYFTKGLDQYCERTHQCQGNPHQQALVQQSWGLADYYIYLDWSWVLYFGQSLIQQPASDVTGNRRAFP